MPRYVFIAPQRSGHHAVLKWFAAQHKQDFTHINNAWIAGDSTVKGSNDKKPYCNCCNPYRTIRDHSKNKLNVIWNFENRDFDYVHKACDILKYDKKPIVVLRDHYNFIASYIAQWSAKRLLDQNAILQWLEYAQEYLENGNDHYYFINYNKWVSSKDYREQICKDFGLKLNDVHFKTQPKHGSGSSFKYHLRGVTNTNSTTDKVKKRDYLNRWLLMKDDPTYQSMVLNPKLIKVTKNVFDMNCPI